MIAQEKPLTALHERTSWCGPMHGRCTRGEGIGKKDDRAARMATRPVQQRRLCSSAASAAASGGSRVHIKLFAKGKASSRPAACATAGRGSCPPVCQPRAYEHFPIYSELDQDLCLLRQVGTVAVARDDDRLAFDRRRHRAADTRNGRQGRR